MPTLNPYQSTPTAAGVSKRLPLPPSAHHSSSPTGDLVVSPQAESAPISGHSDLELPGSWPADHGNGMGMQEMRRDKSATGSHIGSRHESWRGSAYMANGSGTGSGNASADRQSMSTASTLTLAASSEPSVMELLLPTHTWHTSLLTRVPVAGPSQQPSLLQRVAYWYIPPTRTEHEQPSVRVQPSVEERLRSTLAATERELRNAQHIVMVYQVGYYIGMILSAALIPTIALMLATLTARWAVIVAAVLAAVACLIGMAMAYMWGSGMLTASQNRLNELDRFSIQLQTFVRAHGHERDLADAEGHDGVGQYQQRFRDLTGRPILQV
ncbi:hypothetical protein LXA43DRAFT_1059785 [Ganoderma leucocontextum]|nr:hypothetical protein LXA43DRAFT_1059785 [Ganoderma leucocontextum]